MRPLARPCRPCRSTVSPELCKNFPAPPAARWIHLPCEVSGSWRRRIERRPPPIHRHDRLPWASRTRPERPRQWWIAPWQPRKECRYDAIQWLVFLTKTWGKYWRGPFSGRTSSSRFECYAEASDERDERRETARAEQGFQTDDIYPRDCQSTSWPRHTPQSPNVFRSRGACIGEMRAVASPRP
jgi:hypothetical protein